MSEDILYGAGAHVFVRIRISHLYNLNCIRFVSSPIGRIGGALVLRIGFAREQINNVTWGRGVAR